MTVKSATKKKLMDLEIEEEHAHKLAEDRNWDAVHGLSASEIAKICGIETEAAQSVFDFIHPSTNKEGEGKAAEKEGEGKAAEKEGEGKAAEKEAAEEKGPKSKQGKKINNPFYDNIQYNYFLESSDNRFYAFNKDAAAMSGLFSNHYYKGNSKALEPEELAAQISYCVKAFQMLDGHRAKGDGGAGGSRLFDDLSGGKNLTTLAEAYLKACLTYLKEDCIDGMTYDGWFSHLGDTIRQFQGTDWSLDWVESSSGADSNAGKDMAQKVFLKYLRAEKSIGAAIGDYLQGTQAEIKIVSLHWDKVKDKKLENKLKTPSDSATYAVGTANIIFALDGPAGKEKGRTGFRIEIPKDVENTRVTGVYDAELQMNPKLTSAGPPKKVGTNIEEQLKRDVVGKKGQFKILVKTECYGGKETFTEIRIDEKSGS